ncbi:MAG: GNAT family N-acetyltransferase [Proteobacteria bacterium]|nr:GNAT family N-acetyltransferase [Pseudomonadota bacterium]
MSNRSHEKLTLRCLESSDQPTFDDAIRQFTGSGFSFAFGYTPGDDFAKYLRTLDDQRRGINLLPGQVPSLFLLGVVGDTVVGRLSLRLELTEALRNIGGHIGFGVCPKHREKGYAKAMLRESLHLARQFGLPRVLLTCDSTNAASQRTILACGGRLENMVLDATTGAEKERYWIDL